MNKLYFNKPIYITGDIKYTMLNALIDKYSTPDIIELK
jgi:hypothetical protein